MKILANMTEAQKTELRDQFRFDIEIESTEHDCAHSDSNSLDAVSVVYTANSILQNSK